VRDAGADAYGLPMDALPAAPPRDAEEADATEAEPPDYDDIPPPEDG
jgi:hypothetical protein